MEDLTEIVKAFSIREKLDVEIRSTNGSNQVFRQGDEVEDIALWGRGMSTKEPSHPVDFEDLTPQEIRLGRWMDESRTFVASRGPISIEEFLRLDAKSKAAAANQR